MKKYLLYLFTFLSLINLSMSQSFPDSQILNDLKKYSNQTVECSEFSCNSINKITFNLNQKELVASLSISSRKFSLLRLPFNSNEIKIDSILMDGKTWYQVLLEQSVYKVAVPTGEHIVTVKIHPNSTFISLTQTIPNITVSPSLSLDERNGTSLISIKQIPSANNTKNDLSEKSNYPTDSFYQVSRTLFLNNSWKVLTTINPLFDSTKSTVLEIPLLKGEKILNPDIKVDNNKAIVTVSNQPLSWESSLPSVAELEIPPVNDNHFNQIFSLESSNIWQYTVKGKNPFSIQGDITSWNLWNGETLMLNFKAPAVLDGKTLSLHNLQVNYHKSHETYFYEYSLIADTSLASKIFFTLPEKFKIENLIINNNSINIDKNSQKIPVDLNFGSNTIQFSISTEKPQTVLKSFPYVKFPEKVYNASYLLSSNDWIIYSGGSNVNTEYILFSSFAVLLLVSLFTKKINPKLNLFVIAFILFGFLQNSFIVMLLLPILLTLIKFKDVIIQRFEKNHNASQYNLYQFLLILSSFIFLISFLITLKLGLLDSPSSWTLYDDHTITWFNEIYNSKPIWYIEIDSSIYHILMFVWAIFVSYHLVNIAKLAFKSIFSFELWIKKQIIKPVIESVELSSDELKNNKNDTQNNKSS